MYDLTSKRRGAKRSMGMMGLGTELAQTTDDR
jgi:hypothetical protein